MATRRKPKIRAFKDGGAVPAENIIAPSMETAPAAPSLPDDDPLARALAAQMRAEELQRRSTIVPPAAGDAIDAMPISEHKKAFLRANPQLLQPAAAAQLRFHYQAALNAGVVDDTPQMNDAILSGIDRERERAVSEARTIAERPAVSTRRPQFAAPVSREVPMSTGKRVSDSKMTLTPEEVDIARRSFVDRPDMPPMSNAAKELLYAQMKRKYLAAKADGSYSEDRG